jgi:hypothetical protein
MPLLPTAAAQLPTAAQYTNQQLAGIPSEKYAYQKGEIRKNICQYQGGRVTFSTLFLYLSLAGGNLSRKIEVSNGNTLIER